MFHPIEGYENRTGCENYSLHLLLSRYQHLVEGIKHNEGMLFHHKEQVKFYEEEIANLNSYIEEIRETCLKLGVVIPKPWPNDTAIELPTTSTSETSITELHFEDFADNR